MCDRRQRTAVEALGADRTDTAPVTNTKESFTDVHDGTALRTNDAGHSHRQFIIEKMRQPTSVGRASAACWCAAVLRVVSTARQHASRVTPVKVEPRGSGCRGKIKRLGGQHSEIGQQASSDKTCLEQTKARLRCVRTGPDHFEDVRLGSRSLWSEERGDQMPVSQSKPGGGDSFLRMPPAILRLITQ
ncbi:hypothetical protein EYF80_013378 [Liparis tanakae]|uniref:Uncharacterized protein n=1 Tax=Liparis tanakae TaxID=230148 RepID=A0A4Z2IH73_9TELE|nr:hypothetical protein EYF80_013378 [Liparis tanakae]